MGKLFGTDGVRGVANSELTPELAFQLGKAGAYVLSQSEQRPVVLIGKDTRISGDMLEDALAAGILAMGGNVIKAGVLPTPAVAYLVRYFQADAGVVISASHNPFEYNGIKFFNGEGFKLDDQLENQIEEIILNRVDVSSHITGDALGRSVEAEEDALDLYAQFLKSTVPDLCLTGMKVVLDCANGAAYRVAERVFSDLGAETVVLFHEPNGCNINDHCGSTHPETLQRQVVKEGAALGLAFDGDADRLIAVDEKGRIIDGDRMICICAKMLSEAGKLAKNKAVVTVMSNIGLHRAMEQAGIQVDVTQVGDRYVLERMLETGGIIGGEQSGHIIFLNHTTTGDGILSALQLLAAVKRFGTSLSSLADEITIYPQVLVNARVLNKNKKIYMENQQIREEIEKLEAAMNGEGRVLIRPSGTEPLVRVMLEGKDTEQLTALAGELAALITELLG